MIMVGVANDRHNGIKLMAYLDEGTFTQATSLYGTRGEVMEERYTIADAILEGELVKLSALSTPNIPIMTHGTIVEGDLVGVVMTQPEMTTVSFPTGTTTYTNVELLAAGNLRRVTVMFLGYFGTMVGEMEGTVSVGDNVFYDSATETWMTATTGPLGTVITANDSDGNAVVLY